MEAHLVSEYQVCNYAIMVLGTSLIHPTIYCKTINDYSDICVIIYNMTKSNFSIQKYSVNSLRPSDAFMLQ